MLLHPPILRVPLWQPGQHAQTIWPSVYRKVLDFAYTRERIATPDDDFLDIDWSKIGSNKLVILTHGLEGSSDSQYMRGSSKLFNQHGWDALAWNCRSCSGEMNRQFRMYYHGDTADISTVIQHALQTNNYQQIVLLGFSMGGNITMKYLGTMGDRVPAQIKAATVFSAPCDLESGANILDKPSNWMYKTRFLQKLSAKIRIKNQLFPGRLDIEKLALVKRWRDFDEYFSAPMCGYADAAAFYADSSSRYFVDGIRIPTLLVSAWNDPILTPTCFPTDIAKDHPFFHMEIPLKGGHCGFMTRKRDEFTWAERRALAFCTEFV